MAINDPANQRRSLYGASDRHDMDPMLRIHDVPDGCAHNPWRVETITPLQGLFALNSPFMQQQADLLGGLMQKQSTGSLEEKIRKAYLQVFQRRPDSRETALALDFFQDREFDTEAWSQYAQALLVSNEMQFVD